MKVMSKIFFKGLVTILPIGVTIAILYWLGSTSEIAFGKLVQILIGKERYLPGMGLVFGIVLVFVIGLLMKAWIMKKFWAYGESLLEQIPLVKIIYASVRDLIKYFVLEERESLGKVVMVPIGNIGIRVIGFVTRDNFEDMPKELGGKDTVAVYLPWSYQVGGYTVYVPKSSIIPLNMSFEDAMRMAITGGVSTVKPLHNNSQWIDQKKGIC
ncbi:MAG: DUF502 domain-containing protein [bacterium]